MEPGGREQIPMQSEGLSSRGGYEALSFGGENDITDHKEKASEIVKDIPLEMTPPVPQIVLPQPVVYDDTSDNSVIPQPTPDDATLIANDDDLIEKEWVDKAKKIIAETRDDPYRREVEISKLQIEYIRRRYGREIGKAED